MTLDLIGETGLDLGGLINFEEFNYCEQCSRRKRELAAVNNELLDLNITLATVKGTQKKRIKEFKELAGKRDNFIATTCTTPGACQQLKDEIRTLRSYLMQARNIASLQQEQLSRGYKVHSKAADLTRKGFTACKALSLAKKDLELARKNVEECKIHYNSLEQLKKQLLNLVKEQEQSIKELQETTKNQQKELKETNRVHKLHQKRYLETVEALTNNDKLPSRLVKWIKEVKASVTASPLLAVEEEKSDTELEDSGLSPSGGAPSPAESRVRPFSTDSGIAPSPSDSGVGIDDNSEPSTPQPASTDSRGLCCDYGLKPESRMSTDTGFSDLEITPSSSVESDRKETLVDYSSNTVDNMSDSDDDDDDFISINDRIPPGGSSYSSGSVESPQSLESDEVNALVLTHLSKPLEKQSLLEPELEYCETNTLMSIHPDDILSSKPLGRDPLSDSDILDIDDEFVNILSPVDELTKPWIEEVHASELKELPRLPNKSETEVVSNLDTWPSEASIISTPVSLEQAFETQNQPPLTASEPITEEPKSEDGNMLNPLEMPASSAQTPFTASSVSTLTPMGIPSLTFLPDMTAPLEETYISDVLEAPEFEDLVVEHSRPELVEPSKEDIYFSQKICEFPKEDVLLPPQISGLPKEDVFSPQRMSGLPKEDVFSPQRMSGLPKEDVFSPQKMSDLPKEDVFSPQKMSDLPKEDVFSPQKMSDLPKEDVFSPQRMSDLPKEDVFSPQKMSDLPKEDVFSPQKMSDLPKEDVFSPQKMSDLPKEDVFSPQKMSDLPKEDVFSLQKMSDLPKEDVFSPQRMSGIPKEDVFSPQKMSDLPKEDVFFPQKMSGIPKEDVFSPQKMSGIPKEDVFSPQRMSGLPKEDVFSPQSMSGLPKEDVFSPQRMSGLPKEDVFSPQRMSGLPKEDVFSPQRMSGLAKEDVFSPQRMSGILKEDVFSPQKMSGIPKEDGFPPQKMSGISKEDVFSPQRMSGLPKEDVFSPQRTSDLPKEDVFSPQKMSDLPKEDVFSPQKMSDLPKEDVFSPQRMSGLPKEDVFSPQKMSDLPKEDVFSPQRMSGLPKEDVFSPQKMSDLPKEDVFSPQKMSDLPKEDAFSPQRMSGLPKEDVFSPKKMSDLPIENVFPPQKMSDLPIENVFPPQKMSGLPKKDVFSPQKKTSGLPKEDVLSPQKMSYLPKEDVLSPQKMSDLPKENVFSPQKMSGLSAKTNINPTLAPAEPLPLNKDKFEAELQAMKHSGLFFFGKPIHKEFLENKESIITPGSSNLHSSANLHSKYLELENKIQKLQLENKNILKRMDQKFKKYSIARKRFSNIFMSHLIHTRVCKDICFGFNRKKFTVKKEKSMKHSQREAKGFKRRLKKVSNDEELLLDSKHYNVRPHADNSKILESTENIDTSLLPDKDLSLNIDSRNIYVEFKAETKDADNNKMNTKSDERSAVLFENNLVSSSLVEKDSSVHLNQTICETKHLKQSPNVQRCPSTKLNSSPEKVQISKTMLTEKLDMVSPYLDHNETSTNRKSLDHNSRTSKRTDAIKKSDQSTPKSVHGKEISNLLSTTPRLTRSALARINVSPGVTVASEVTPNVNKKSSFMPDKKNGTSISNNSKKKDMNKDVIDRSRLKKLFPLMGKSSNTKKGRRKRIRTISKSTYLQINSLNNNLVPNLSEKTHQLDKDITPIQLNVGDVLVNEAFQGTPNLHAEKQVFVEVREEPVNSLLHNNGNVTNEDNLTKGKAIPLKTQDSKIIFDRDRERDLEINEFTAKQEMCTAKDLLKQHETEDLSLSNTGAEKGPSHTKTKSLKMKGPQQIQPVSQCTSLQSDLTDNVVERLIPIENTLELNESVTPLKLEVEDEIPNETVLKPLNLSVKKQYNVQDVMTESIQIPLNLSEKQFPFEICKQPPNLKSKDINVHTFKKIKEIHTPKNFLEELEPESEEGLFNRIDKKSPTEAEVLLKDPERDSFVNKKENDLNIHESKERQICIPRNSFKEDKMENQIDLVENVTLFNNDEEKPFIEYENSFIENENSLKPYAETSSCINENSHLNIEGVPPKPLNVYKAATIKMRKPLSIPFADKTPKEGKMRLTEEWLENAKISCISTNRLTTIPIKHQPDIGELDKECVSFTYGSQQTRPVFKTEHDSPMSFGMVCGTDSKVNLKGEFVSIEVKEENYGKEIVDQKSAKHEDNNYDIVSQIEKYEENVNVAQNLKPEYEENVNVAQNLKPEYEENVNVAQNLKTGYEENVNVAQNLKPGYEENVNVAQNLKPEYEENVNVAQNLKPGYEENVNVAQNLKPEYEENVNVAQNLKPEYEENVNVAQNLKHEYEENVNVAQNLKPEYEENVNFAQNLKPEYEENVNVLQKVKPGYEANVNAPQIVKPKYKENSYASQSNTLKIKTEVLDDFDQKTNISTKIKSEKSETIGMPGIRNYTKVKPKIEVVDRFTDTVKVNKKADAVGDIYLIPNAKPKRIAHQVKSEKQELGDFQNALDLLLKKEPSRELGRSQGKSQPVTPSIKSNSKISHSSGNTRLSVTKKPSLCALVSNKDEAQVMTSISDEKTNITKNMTSRKRRIMESKSIPPKKPSSSSLFSNKDEAQVMTSISDEQTNFTENMTSRKRRILESKSLPPKKRISSSLFSNKDEAEAMTSISDEQTNFTKNMTSRKRKIVESKSVPPKRIRKKMVEKDSTGPAISVPTRKSSTQLDSPEPRVRKAQFPEPVQLPELVPLPELPPQSALGSKNRENLYSESLCQSTSKTVALYRPRGHHMSGNQFQSHSSYTFEKYESFAGSPAPYFTENKMPYHSMVQNVMNMGIATSTVITTTPYPHPPKNFFKPPHPCNKHSSESVLFRDDLNEPDDPNLKRFSNKKPKFWHNVKDVTHFLSHTFRNFWRKNFKKKMFSKSYQEEIDSMAHQKDEVPEILKQYLDKLIGLKDAIDMLVPRKFFTESHMISVNIIIEITRRSTEKAELPNYSRDNFSKKSYFEDSLLLLVAGLVRADERFRYLPQQLYDRVQLRLFRLHHTPSCYSVYSLTRFCVQLCLWQAQANNGIHREVWHDYISLFCYDALYCLNYSAIAVIYVTIHLYENILERVKEGKVDSIWSVVMAHVVLSQNNNKSNPIYKLEETKKLVESYGYKRGGIMVHHVTNYLLHKLERGRIKDVEACFLIIAKKNSWGWVYDNIIRKLLNMIDSWMKGEDKIKVKACMVAIRTVSFVCRSFDKKAKHMLEKVFKKIAEVIDASAPKLDPIDMRCVVESLVVLKRHISPKLFIPTIIKVPECIHVHYTTVSQLYSNMKGTAWEGFSWGDVLATIPASTSVIHGSKRSKKSFNDSQNTSTESLNLPSTSTSSSLVAEPNYEASPTSPERRKTSK